MNDEKRTDLLFQALDKLKEAEIMVSQHILSDTYTKTNTNTITNTKTNTNTNTNINTNTR
jgi:hypothetical protein